MKRIATAVVTVIVLTVFTLACGQRGACAEELAGRRTTRRSEQAQAIESR